MARTSKLGGGEGGRGVLTPNKILENTLKYTPPPPLQRFKTLILPTSHQKKAWKYLVLKTLPISPPPSKFDVLGHPATGVVQKLIDNISANNNYLQITLNFKFANILYFLRREQSPPLLKAKLFYN